MIAGQAKSSGVEVHEAVGDDEGHSWEMIAKTWPYGLELLARHWGIA
ncbi:MAG: hypothetical protein HOQ07_08480 [Sinomonas sp.]|nr:hypothetical protein [Sinomonas sp.]